MNSRELDRLLKASATAASSKSGPAALADTILSTLPGMRFVIPGSHPGLRLLVIAGILGLGTAIAISLLRRKSDASESNPPPFELFQSEAVEPRIALPR